MTGFELARRGEDFGETHRTGEAREDPEHRQDGGRPERNARGLRQEEARVGRRGHAQDRVDHEKTAGVRPAGVLPHAPGLNERQHAEHREDADADEHPAAEVELPFDERVDRGHREVQHARQVRDHKQGPDDGGGRRHVEDALRAKPPIEEEAHACQAHEPEEERDRPPPMRRGGLARQFNKFVRHFTTTK